MSGDSACRSVGSGAPLEAGGVSEGKRMAQLRKTFARTLDQIFEAVDVQQQLELFPAELIELKGALIKDYCAQISHSVKANIEVCCFVLRCVVRELIHLCVDTLQAEFNTICDEFGLASKLNKLDEAVEHQRLFRDNVTRV